MNLIKGIVAFIIINLGVFLAINLIFLILSFFGIHVSSGNNLILYSIIIGSVSSIISLFSSVYMVKKIYNIQIIGEDISPEIDPKVLYLYNRLNELASKYGYKDIKLGIYSSDEPNAFATGCGFCGYLIAFSTGIIETMTEEELDGVLGHEFAHIRNNDVVLTTMLQGFLNIFVVYFSHILADNFSDEEDNNFVKGLVIFILEFLLGLVVSIFLAYISRIREYKADYDSATKYSNPYNMLNALLKLKNISDIMSVDELDRNNNLTATLKINNYMGKLMGLFSTHPDLESRIERIYNLINK